MQEKYLVANQTSFDGDMMEKKTARLTLLIDPHKKKAFEALCAAQDLTPSQVVRQLIRDYLREHDVEYQSQPEMPGKGRK